MNRARRAAHRRIWWVLGPTLLLAVLYGVLFPATLPVADAPEVLKGGAP